MSLSCLLKLVRREASIRFRSRRASSAFTLVEMLVVMLIIGVLTLLAVPALSSLSNSGNVNGAVTGVSLLLDQARTYAMGHNTYVWVGFSQNTTNQQLIVGVVAGTTGQASDLTTSSAAGVPNYAPIIKLQTFSHLSLSTTITALSNTGLSSLATSADDISKSNSDVVGLFKQQGVGMTVTFNSDVLQFSPQGEATLGITPSDGSHWIQIGLQPERGNNTSDPNVAVLQVATLTGLVNVFRP
jgi:prepilin-type N-terminal cleavage/methylation domain-containing protein